MSDSRPVDQPQNDALRTRLEAWLNQQNQTLLEEVMATWQNALGNFHPDETLLAQLREGAAPSPVLAPAGPQAPDLAPGLDLLEGAASQSDLLKRLLDALGPLAERSALFILKQGLASLYAHRGFEGDAPRKAGAIVPPEELEALIHGSTRAIRRKGAAYTALLGAISPFEASDAAIFPLRHKKRAVALVLVDSGLRPTLDHPEQVRAMVLVASGQTLGRVLVGDVELYFPAKVALAHTKGNLYGQLRDELERSRATFVERFGEDVEARYRIFTTTVIQQQCDGDDARHGGAIGPTRRLLLDLPIAFIEGDGLARTLVQYARQDRPGDERGHQTAASESRVRIEVNRHVRQV